MTQVCFMNWLIWSSLHFSKAILLNLLRKSISSFDYSVPVFWSQAKQIVLWKESLKIKFCHHDFWNLQLLDTHVVLLAKNFLLKKFQQSLFLWRLTEQKRLFVTGEMPQKFYFLCFVEMKIGPSWAYILSFKSLTCEPILLKFDQLTVI